MPRPVSVVLVVALTLLAGCNSHVQPRSPTPTAASPTVDCDTFGTGGVFPVTDANTTVTSRDAATSALESARSNGSLDEPAATEFAYVPRESVDSREAVRDEISRLPANATLYYFSPDNGTDVHEMAIVSETGRIYRAYVGAC